MAVFPDGRFRGRPEDAFAASSMYLGQLLEEGAVPLEPNHIDYHSLVQIIQQPNELKSQADSERPRQLGLDLYAQNL